MNWKTEKSYYIITEVSKKKFEQYTVLMTGAEVKKWCKTHRDSYGYIEGVGGDRSYDCYAVLKYY